MSKENDLFEFLCNLMDIQIKKYVTLASTGVGPDARLNAKLVLDEVDELLTFAQKLLKDIENQVPSEQFTPIFNQVKFYVEQEYDRTYAAWLLDENTHTTPIYKRAQEQLTQLQQIALANSINCSQKATPLTQIQKQCEYDSSTLAFCILDLANKLKENPELELSEQIPGQARTLLKQNALKRYCKAEFAKPIAELHQYYADFLQLSTLKKNNSSLSKEEALAYKEQHQSQYRNLRDRYQKIALKPSVNKKAESVFWSPSSFFWEGLFTAGTLTICMLISYFSQQDTDEALASLEFFLNPM